MNKIKSHCSNNKSINLINCLHRNERRVLKNYKMNNNKKTYKEKKLN